MEQRVFTALVTDHRLGRSGSSQQGRFRIQISVAQLEKQSESNEVPFLRTQVEGSHQACILSWAGGGLTQEVARSHLFSRIYGRSSPQGTSRMGISCSR